MRGASVNRDSLPDSRRPTVLAWPTAHRSDVARGLATSNGPVVKGYPTVKLGKRRAAFSRSLEQNSRRH